MSSPNRACFRMGAAVFIAGGAAHAVLIDLLAFTLRKAELSPHGEVFATMEQTTLSWGILGHTILYRAVTGFSLWVGLSLMAMGILYLLLSREPQLRLDRFAVLGAIISLTFFAISATCFIWPPTVGAGAATALFALSRLRNEA